MAKHNAVSLVPTEFVDLPNAAKLLGGIGRTYLYKLISSGELPRIKLGRRTLVAVADIRALLEARKTAEPLTKSLEGQRH